jgi:glycosyltransferase involved in cell wall biosynthesis
MLVAVEATRLYRDVRGIGRYVRTMLPRLAAARPGLRLILFARRRDEIALHTAWIAENAELRGRAFVRHIREFRTFSADIHWYAWNVASPLPRRGAVVVTMHDVAPIALPDPRWLSWRKNLRWRMRYAATARRADMIVADSSFSADEIHRRLAVPRDRIRVVHLAADDFAVANRSDDFATLVRLGVRPPFVLSVGANDRRKNLGLVQGAMERVTNAIPSLTLVLAGPRRDTGLRESNARWMRTLGIVSDEDLRVLYRSATALVMASTYEGFGLPVLEAMQMGTPVVCARASSLPEVAGEAAMWFMPGDEEALARAISVVASDALTRVRMRVAGLKQTERFSWDQTARQTLDAFDEALTDPRTPIVRGVPAPRATLATPVPFGREMSSPGARD